MPAKKILVVGADGQLGKALRELYDGDASVEFAGRADSTSASEDVLRGAELEELLHGHQRRRLHRRRRGGSLRE